MRKNTFTWKVLFTLLVFSPLALLPAPGRAALLSSRSLLDLNAGIIKAHALDNLLERGIARDRAEELLEVMSTQEIEVMAFTPPTVYAGGTQEGIRESLMSNETAAIVITLIMLAVIVGAVEISRH